MERPRQVLDWEGSSAFNRREGNTVSGLHHYAKLNITSKWIGLGLTIQEVIRFKSENGIRTDHTKVVNNSRTT